MRVIFDHNGEMIALGLAATCAWAIASGVMHFAAGSPDAVYIPGIAAASAVVTTWCLWRLLVAYGNRLLLLRSAVAGGLAGALSHPVFMFAVLLRDAIAACADSACVVGSVLTVHGIGVVAAGSGIFSIMGLVMVGPVTIPVGALGGILAVVLSRSGRRRESETQDAHDSGVVRDSGA